MEDIYIGHNYIEDVAQGGIDLCDARNAVVEYNVVDGFLKRYPNFRPTVALYPWKCENSVLQYNEVYNGPSTNADGSPYDMDSALKNVSTSSTTRTTIPVAGCCTWGAIPMI